MYEKFSRKGLPCMSNQRPATDSDHLDLLQPSSNHLLTE